MEQARLSLISYGSHKEKYSKAIMQPGAEIPLHIPLVAGKVHIGTQASPTLMSVTLQQIDAGVSRTHCIIERTTHLPKPTWTITDMSTNGTYINDERCEFGKSYPVPNMCVIVFGDPSISALRYQFSVGMGVELGKRTRAEAGKATPVLVPAEAIEDSEVKRAKLPPPPSDSSFDQLRSLSTLFHKSLPPVLLAAPFLCAYCQHPFVAPLDLPCKHIICFLCFDSVHFQGKKRTCDVCNGEVDQFRLPLCNLTLQQRLKNAAPPASLGLLTDVEQIISQREVYILKILRLREAGYAQSLRESQEPLFSQNLSQDYLRILVTRLKTLSPSKKSILLRSKGLDPASIDRADERELTLVLDRLELGDGGKTVEEKRETLRRLVGN